MATRWSRPIKLEIENKRNIPAEEGLYEIGFFRRPTGNENRKFNPMYIGTAKVLSKRFADHIGGKGNRFVKEHLDRTASNNLFFRFRLDDNPECSEALHLQTYGIGKRGQYKWNQKVEDKRCKLNWLDRLAINRILQHTSDEYFRWGRKIRDETRNTHQITNTRWDMQHMTVYDLVWHSQWKSTFILWSWRLENQTQTGANKINNIFIPNFKRLLLLLLLLKYSCSMIQELVCTRPS